MTKMSLTTLHDSIIETLPEPHCVIGRDLTCVALNSAFAELLGASPDEIRGRPVVEFWADIDKVRWQNREFRAEFRYRACPVLLVKLASYSGNELVIRVLASFSEDRATKVFHNQRIEALGLLAGGVAHDFNNLLTGVLGHVAYLRHVLPAEGEHAESLAAIEEGALRASSLTQQILMFSKVDGVEPTVKVDLADVVSRVLTLLKSSIPSHVEIEWQPPAQPFPILALEAHLTQIVINLVINARDAIKDKGSIIISLVERCQPDDVRRLFGEEPPAPAYGALIVADSGEGMDEEVKSKLFEPYFTTKNEGGTGIGLSTVNSIVEQLGGAIEVDSQQGVGTEFRIIFPLLAVEEQTELLQAQDDSKPLKGRGERVLVIDDEYAVRNVLGLSLSHLGYAIETAASGLEGIEKFVNAGGDFDLVILDLLMPGLSGEEVFNRILEINRGARVLIVSGFSSEHVVQRILESGGRDFIQKPFSIEVLSRKVRGCLYD